MSHLNSSKSSNVYTSLNGSDHKLIGTGEQSDVKEDSKNDGTSSDSTLIIIPLFESKSNSNATNDCCPSQTVASCCICQAAWGHWKTELSIRGKIASECYATQPVDMNSTCADKSTDSVCRICLEERGNEGFISPCDCSGTMGMVHRSCLERWLSLLNSSECEICRHKFSVRRYMRPARQFQLSQLPLDLCGDLICITVLSPLCILIFYFTIDATWTNFKQGRTTGAVILIVIAAVVILIYFLWIYCTIKQALSFWWGSNRVVRLSANQVAPANDRSRR